jgi:hypothetical protein
MPSSRNSFEINSGLVGAGRFERPTPCAQGGLRPAEKVVYFQRILFQADGAILLNLVELFGI